jgi:Fe-S-cluster-containing dehydrogenase component
MPGTGRKMDKAGRLKMKSWNLIIDVAKCENCNNCFLACKDEYVGNDWLGYSASQPSQRHTWINILSKERGQHPFIDVAFLPVPCQHCRQAPCLEASKDGAVYRRPDGIVIIDPVKAKGQKQIVSSCPYGAIRWNEELQIPQKCTLCAHLLDGGWTKCRCSQSCPTGALTLLQAADAELDELIKAENLETYRPDLGTQPHVYYKNLYRFTRCFIGGSVAARINGQDECLAGATVTLSKTSAEKVGECATDNYGDFKFDNLLEKSGKFVIKISHAGYADKSLEVDLSESLYLGVVFVQAK